MTQARYLRAAPTHHAVHMPQAPHRRRVSMTLRLVALQGFKVACRGTQNFKHSMEYVLAEEESSVQSFMLGTIQWRICHRGWRGLEPPLPRPCPWSSSTAQRPHQQAAAQHGSSQRPSLNTTACSAPPRILSQIRHCLQVHNILYVSQTQHISRSVAKVMDLEKPKTTLI